MPSEDGSGKDGETTNSIRVVDAWRCRQTKSQPARVLLHGANCHEQPKSV